MVHRFQDGTNELVVLHSFSVFSTLTETYHRLSISTEPED